MNDEPKLTNQTDCPFQIMKKQTFLQFSLKNEMPKPHSGEKCRTMTIVDDQTNTQRNERTNERTNNKTNDEQTNKQNEQTNKQTEKQTSKEKKKKMNE